MNGCKSGDLPSKCFTESRLFTRPWVICTMLKVKSSRAVSNECASNCPFHDFAEKLNNAKNLREFSYQIAALLRLVWYASYKQRMTLCMVEVVREAIQICKRTKVPIGPLVQFYDFRFRCWRIRDSGKLETVPTWIILQSPRSDEQSKTSTRHLLLQTYLDELPLTPAIRDELYLACAEKGFNNYFNRVRLASLSKRLQARHPKTHETHTEIERWLALSVKLAESLTVVHTTRGFKLNCFVPNMLQRLQSGLAIGMEFVAKGNIWGLYIRAQRGRLVDPRRVGLDVALCMFKPSKVNLEGNIVASFRISRHEKKRKFFDKGSTDFVLYSDHIETSVFPAEGDMPATQSLWLLSGSTMNSYRCINKDGSCYLTLDLVINPTSTSKPPASDLKKV